MLALITVPGPGPGPGAVQLELIRLRTLYNLSLSFIHALILTKHVCSGRTGEYHRHRYVEAANCKTYLHLECLFDLCCCLGGGIIGCTCAYYLTRHPRFDASRHSITIIEAARIANGASGKAGGLLASWASPSNIAELSFDLHAQLAAEHGGEELWGYRRVHCGQLTAVGQRPLENSEAEANGWDPSSSNIQLGKWWKRERELGNQSILPDDLDWFRDESATSYEEFADTSSTAQV